MLFDLAVDTTPKAITASNIPIPNHILAIRFIFTNQIVTVIKDKAYEG